jgi:hypothetical protein
MDHQLSQHAIQTEALPDRSEHLAGWKGSHAYLNVATDVSYSSESCPPYALGSHLCGFKLEVIH